MNEPTHGGLCKLALAEGFTVRAEAGFPLWSLGLAGEVLLFCGASSIFFFGLFLVRPDFYYFSFWLC